MKLLSQISAPEKSSCPEMISLSGAPVNYISFKAYITTCPEVDFTRKLVLFTQEEVEIIKQMYPDHFNYEIAEKLNRSPNVINQKIGMLGLSGRPRTKILQKQRAQAMIEHKHGVPIEWLLKTMHWTLKMPQRNGMDKKLGISTDTICKWMNGLNIPHRTIAEDNHRRYETMTREQIDAQVASAHESIRRNGQPKHIGKIGWSRGLSKETHPGLKSSSEKHTGEKNYMFDKTGEQHHLWKGGKIWWRGKRWDAIKQIVKERDNYTCQYCGITEEKYIAETGQPLQVHHIELYRTSKNNNIENLKTACGCCHTKEDVKNLKNYKHEQKGEKCIQKKLF